MFVLLAIALWAGPPAEPRHDGPKEIATRMAKALLAGDPDALTKLTPNGFSFDGRTVYSSADARAEWLHALEQRSLAGVQLYGVELLSYDEMLKRHGPPPARLSQLNFAGTTVAIVDLGGRAIEIVFKRRGDDWSPVAISD